MAGNMFDNLTAPTPDTSPISDASTPTPTQTQPANMFDTLSAPVTPVTSEPPTAPSNMFDSLAPQSLGSKIGDATIEAGIGAVTPGGIGSFLLGSGGSNAAKAGAMELKAAPAKLAAWADKYMGDTQGEAANLAKANAIDTQSQAAYPAPFKDIPTAIHADPSIMGTIGNVWKQGQYDLIKGVVGNAPSIAAMAAAAVASGGTTAVGAGLVEAGSLAEAADAVMTTGMKRWASGVGATATVGAAASLPQNIGNSYVDQIKETGVHSPTSALTVGLLSSAIQMLPLENIAGSIIPKPMVQAVSDTIARQAIERLTMSQLPAGILKTAAIGGVAGGAQTEVQQIANKIMANAPYDLLSEDHVNQLIDGAFQGAVGNAGMHGILALPGAFKGSMNKADPENDYTHADVLKNSLPGPLEGDIEPPGSSRGPWGPKGSGGPSGATIDGVYRDTTGQEALRGPWGDKKTPTGESPMLQIEDAKTPTEAPTTQVKGETPQQSQEAVKDVLDSVTPPEAVNTEPTPQVPYNTHDAEFGKFAEKGNYPQTIEGVHGAAKDYLLSKWDAQKDRGLVGTEHLIAVDDKTGEAFNYVKGKKGEVYRGDETTELTKDPNNSITIHHTHPNESTLSRADISNLLTNPGESSIVAHTPNGISTSAELTPQMKTLVKGMGPVVSKINFKSLYRAANTQVVTQLKGLIQRNNNLIKSGNSNSPEAIQLRASYNNLRNTGHQIVNEALHNAGVINLKTDLTYGNLDATIKNDLLKKATEAVQKTANTRRMPLNATTRPPDRYAHGYGKPREVGRISPSTQSPPPEDTGDTGGDTGSSVDNVERSSPLPPLIGGATSEPQEQPFNPDNVERNINNSEPHENLKANNFAIPKALDRITQEVTGNKSYNKFHTLASDHTQVDTQTKANLYNTMRLGMDLVRGNAGSMFKGADTPITEFFQHALDPANGLLKEADLKALERSMPGLRAYMANKTGLNPRDVLTNYPDDVIQAQGFVYFMQHRYEMGAANPFQKSIADAEHKKLIEGLGNAGSVFNKLANLLYRQGQVLNANNLSQVEHIANGLGANQLNDALYAINEKRWSDWNGRRVGESINHGRDININDPDFTDLANIQDPDDIKHLSRSDDLWGTAMYMASKYPWMSDTIQFFDDKRAQMGQINKKIGTIPRMILAKHKNNFNEMHDILDAGRMSNTSAKITGTPGNKTMTFKYPVNGKLQTRVWNDQNRIEEFEALRNNYRATVEEDEGDFRRYLNKNYGMPEMSTPTEIRHMAKRMQDTIDASTSKDGIVDPMAKSTLGPQIKELMDLAKALDNMRKMKHIDYVPHLRFGKRAVMVHQIVDDPSQEDPDSLVSMTHNGRPIKAKLVHLSGIEESDKGKVNPLQQQEMEAQIQKYRSQPNRYIIQGDKKTNSMRLTQNDTLKKIPPQHVTAELIHTLFGNQDDDTAEAMQELIKGKINGSKLAFYLRPSSNIEGYSRDWPRSMETWTKARAINQANKQTDEGLTKILSNFEQLQKNGAYHPHDIQWLKKWIDYNRDRRADLMTYRSADFLWAMGMRMSTAMFQLVNGPQRMVPALYVGGGNALAMQANYANHMRKATMLIKNTWGNGGIPINSDTLWDKPSVKAMYPDPVVRSALKGFCSSHMVDNTILDDNSGTSYESRTPSGQFKKQVQLTTHVLGGVIGEAEKLGRIASFAAAMEHLQNPENFRRLLNAYKDDAGWQAVDKTVTGRLKGSMTQKEALANYVVEMSHARYGKSGRGKIQRGLISVTIATFATQMLTQWEQLKHMSTFGGNRGKIAVMYVLATYLAFGGLKAMPGYESMKDGYNIYDAISNEIKDVPDSAKSFDIDARRWLTNALGEKWADNLFNGPARNILGVDMSNRVTAPMSIESAIAKPVDIMTGILSGRSPDLTEVMGPASSPLTGVVQAAKEHSFRPLLPPTARDIGDAVNGMDPSNPTGGIKTLGGVQIEPSMKPVGNSKGYHQYSVPERIVRAMGFTPTAESKAKEGYHEQNFSDNANRERSGALVHAAIEAQVNLMTANRQGNEVLANAYREQKADIRKSWVNFQRQCGQKHDADTFDKSVMQGAMQLTKGWKPKTKAGKHIAKLDEAEE